MAGDETAIDELREKIRWLLAAAVRWADIPVTTLPDGRVAVVEPLLFGYRLYWGTPGALGYDDDSGFEYDSLEALLHSVTRWEKAGFGGEPQGWHRHIGTMRRRPDGDPSKEYVRP